MFCLHYPRETKLTTTAFLHGCLSRFVATATPYVSQTDLSVCGDCPMLILACDGVWDVFSDQEAADLLMERYLAGGPFEDAANVLVSPYELYTV